MTEKYTSTLTFTKRGKNSDNGKWASFLEPQSNKWCRIHMGHADKITVGQACDVDYAVSDRGGVFINKVNGTDVSRAPTQPMGGGAGGPLGASAGGGGPLGAKAAPGASGGGYESAWAAMGPENRARQACLHWLEAKASIKEWDHGGATALAAELNVIFHGWLQGVESRNPHSGGARAEMDEALGGDQIPDNYAGPGEDDYVE